MKCPKCQFANSPGASECESCGVQFRDLRREAGRQRVGGELCDWNDHGEHCQFRAVAFVGRALCREHWDRSQGRPAAGRGNYRVNSVRSEFMRRWDSFHVEQRQREALKQTTEWMEDECYGDFRRRVEIAVGQG